MVEGVDQLESYFHLLELMLLVALQVQLSFLLRVVLELLMLLEQIEEQLELQELLELQEQQLGLLLDFVLQH